MASEKNSKNKLRRIALWLVITVMVLLAGIYTFRSVLIAPLAITLLERTIEANLKLKVSIGELGGSYFSGIEVINVTTIMQPPDSPLSDFQLRRLKATYRLWDLFRGVASFLAGVAIDIEGAQVSIDLTKEMGLDDDKDAQEGVLLPSILPQIRVHNSSLRVKSTGFETHFDGISLVTRSAQPGGSRLQLRVAQWSLNHPAVRNIAVALDADLSYSNENLMIEKVLIDKQLIVKSATIGLGGLPHQIPFEMVLNLAGGQFDASGRMTADRLHVALSGSDIDLSRISELMVSRSLPFGGRLALRGQLSLPLSNPRDMIGDLKIQVLDGSVQDTTLEQLVFRFIAGGRYLRVEDFRLTTGANRISINRASVPVEVVYAAGLDSILRSLAVEWSLEGTNIPSILKTAGVAFGEHDDRIPSHRLKLNGRMEDGRVIMPDGSLHVDGGYILLKAADIALPIGERTLKDSPLAGDLSIDLPQVEVLSRIFALPPMGGAIKGKIKVSGTLHAPEGAATISGQALTYRNMTLGNLSIRAKADIQSVAIESAVLERGKDRAIGHGTLILAEKSFENVNVELSVLDLGPYFSELPPLLGPPSEKALNVRGELKAALKLAGPFAGPTGSLSLQARQIRVEGTPFGDADIDLSFSADRVKVSSAEFRNLNDRLHLSGSIRYRQKQLDDVKVQAAISDLSAYKALWKPASTNLSGSLQVRLRAAGNIMRPDAEADLQLENFRFNDVQLEKGSAQLKSTGGLIRIQSAELTKDRQRLQLAGDIRRNADDSEFDITLRKATVIGQSTLLALEHAATGRLFRNGRIIFDNVALAGSAGRVSINGRFDPSGSSDLRIAVSDLTGDGWFDLIVTDRFRFRGLNARLSIAGPIDAPFFVVQGTLDNLGSPDVPMAFSGRFNLEYGHKFFKIHEFAWQGTKGQQVHLTGTLPLNPLRPDIFIPGPITLKGRARIDDVRTLGFIIPWVEKTGGSIQCDLDLSGTWKHPTGTLHLAVKDLKRPADIRPLPPGPYTATGNVRIDGDLVALESLEAYASGWKVQVRGQWRGAPTLPDLIGSAALKATGEVNLAGSLVVSDLSWVAREVDGVRRLTGRLEAQGSLQGPITAPDADAIIKFSDAEFAPDFDMPSLRGLNLEAVVTPQAVDVRSLTGELGGAPFELTGSWKLAAGTGPAADLRLVGENLLLYRDEYLRLRSDTDLTLKGPLARLELAGEVAVTDGRFSKNFGVLEGFAAAGRADSGGAGGFQLFSLRKPPLRDMVFNVRITAKAPFVVRNNLVRGSVRPDLVLTGTGEVPQLIGKVYVESTRLYLPAGRMKLETGLMRFDQADPDRPRLDLIGTATMLGYDITAVIDGPYDEPVITLSSIPPLPNDELLMLLLTGQPPKNSSARSNAAHQSLNVAMFLGRDLIGRLFGDDSDEAFEFILDRFDVEVGRAITQRGEDTIHSQFRLADNILVEGDGLYLTGERDYFDYYNGGIKLVFRFR